MAIAEATDLQQYCLATARKAQAASAELAIVSTAKKNDWLRRSAAELRRRFDEIRAANELDLAAAPG